MDMKQWGFFNVPHYCDIGEPFIIVKHIRGPVKLTPVAERLAMELSLPVLKT